MTLGARLREEPAEGARWDLAALWSGAITCLMFAVPFSIAARWAADSRDDSALATMLSLGAVIGFVVGSGVAAWAQRVDLPLSHGLVTATATYIGAQAVFVSIRAALGGEIHWFAALFNLAPVLGAGLIGGILGRTLRRQGIVPGGRPRRG